MTNDERIDEVLRCLLMAQDCFVDLMLREKPDIEQAILELQIALIRLRQMTGGKEATASLIARAKAELDKREAARPDPRGETRKGKSESK